MRLGLAFMMVMPITRARALNPKSLNLKLKQISSYSGHLIDVSDKFVLAENQTLKLGGVVTQRHLTLELQEDGNLVLLADGGILWQTRTGKKGVAR